MEICEQRTPAIKTLQIRQQVDLDLTPSLSVWANCREQRSSKSVSPANMHPMKHPSGLRMRLTWIMWQLLCSKRSKARKNLTSLKAAGRSLTQCKLRQLVARSNVLLASGRNSSSATIRWVGMSSGEWLWDYMRLKFVRGKWILNNQLLWLFQIHDVIV